MKSIDRYSTRLLNKVKTVVAAHVLGVEQERLLHLQFFYYFFLCTRQIHGCMETKTKNNTFSSSCFLKLFLLRYQYSSPSTCYKNYYNNDYSLAITSSTSSEEYICHVGATVAISTFVDVTFSSITCLSVDSANTSASFNVKSSLYAS